MLTESNTKLQQMRAQLAELQAQIEEEKETGRAEAIEQIRALMDAYSLTPEDLGAKTKLGPKKHKAGPKYRDPATGATWSGVGREPLWLKGKKRERFLIV
jgi:DNA-binding protein H-NS